MTLSVILFLIAILGFLVNRKNIIILLIRIELILLSVTIIILCARYNFNDIIGQVYSIYIIAIAGAESAIGLGILVCYYRLRGNISVELLMYSVLIFLPILGSIAAGLYGRVAGVKGAQIITTSCIRISAILSLVAFYEVALCNSPVQIDFGRWIDCGLINIHWSFMFDSLTVRILLAVLIVSSLVHVFSIDYISADPHNQRFFSYLRIFTFFIVILVTANNYLVIFVGWEFIGISRYLLINFWYTRAQANKSAIKALVVNRVGDIFLSIAFFAIFFVFGNVDYDTTFSCAPYINEQIITIIGLLLLLAAIGKRAQFILHVWLADAIEGETQRRTNVDFFKNFSHQVFFLFITLIYYNGRAIEFIFVQFKRCIKNALNQLVPRVRTSRHSNKKRKRNEKKNQKGS